MAEQEQMNFILYMPETLRAESLACYGHPLIQTPNLDRLAAQGMRLTHCYAAAANCSPARTGLMTGRTPYRAGIHNWIPMYSPSPKAKRVEVRYPDPSCNPYLAFTAMLMAGIDGIENKIDPGDPLDKDIYALSPKELENVPRMPASLEEALECLHADHAFLLKGDVFTEDALQTWLAYKREAECAQVALRPHPHEFELYYDI